MREQPVQLRREDKVLVRSDTRRPRFSRCWHRRAIEAAIDLDRVEKPREVFKRIKRLPRLLRVHDSFPVLIRPAGRTNADNSFRQFSSAAAVDRDPEYCL